MTSRRTPGPERVPPVAPTGQRTFLAHVEGLRALAVVLVLLYHAGFSVVGGGYIGVDVFFVISGFLITGLLLDELERTGRISFARFYARRARRLLPIATLVLVVTAVASWKLLPPVRWASTSLDVIAGALWSANVRFAVEQTNYLTAGDGQSPVLHYWSLGVEEQYYLVWPVVLVVVYALMRRLGISARGTVATLCAATIAGSFMLTLRWTGTEQPYAFFLLPSRAWEMAAGGLLAAAFPLVHRVPRHLRDLAGAIGLATIVPAALRFDGNTAWPGTSTLVPVVATLALIATGGLSARLLGLAPMRALGRWSYSMYLWHWPMLVLIPVALGRPLQPVESGGVLLVATVVSATTYRLVERPVRHHASLQRSHRRSLVFGVALVSTSVLAGGGVNAAPVPMPKAPAVAASPYAALLTAADDVTDVPANLDPSLTQADDLPYGIELGSCFGDSTARTAPASGCYFGDTSSTTTFALIGDSHAAQWTGALDQVARQRGVRLLVLAKSACSAMTLARANGKYGTYPECQEWNESVRARLTTEAPQITFVASYSNYALSREVDRGKHRTEAWTELFALLSEFTRPVLLTDTPYPNIDVPECLSVNLTAVGECVQSRPQMQRSNDGRQDERLAATAAGVGVIDTYELVCPTQRCPVIVGNVLVYRDKSHLSGAFSRWIAPELANRLELLLLLATP